MDSKYSKEDLLDLWTRVVDPSGIGMQEAIAREISSYTGEPVSNVLEKMATGKDEFKQLWQRSMIDISDSKTVEGFYEDQFVEAYELADWHCGRTNGVPPLSYARAALFAQGNGLRRVLDFGCGIGTGSLCLASVGCEVHCADVGRELLKFVGHRFSQRGLFHYPIDLCAGELPRKGYYDIITCFDVLEHITDQLSKLRELSCYLRNGGYLCVNLMNDSSHPDRPMHISSAGKWLAVVRRTQMCPDWANFSVVTGEAAMQVLIRRRGGRLQNHAASWVDWFQGV